MPFPAARAAYAPLMRAGYNVFRRKLVRLRQRRAARRVAVAPTPLTNRLSTQALLHLSTPTQFYKHRGDEMEFSQMQQVRPRRARPARLAFADLGAPARQGRVLTSYMRIGERTEVELPGAPSQPDLQRQRRSLCGSCTVVQMAAPRLC